MANAAECIARSIRVSEGTERHALHPFRRFHPAGIGKYVDLQYNIQAADTQDMPLLFHHFFCQILGTVDLKTRLYNGFTYAPVPFAGLEYFAACPIHCFVMHLFLDG